MPDDTPDDAVVHPDLRPGARVEVRTRFDGSWATGFEVAAADVDGCHIRRLSDGSMLPRVFPADEVRRDRSPGSGWG
ncbi:MAG TPA: hypothetical protein VK306_00070 [Acidimicrobiales bacterium]|nr:hypothetical protein [Acidimicrobiales bacterium]